MGASRPRRQLCAGEQGGSGGGHTKIGTGSQVLAGADGQGVPLGWSGCSAPPPESPLAAATLATVRGPPPRGRPRSRPKAVVAANADDRRAWRQRRRRRGLNPPIPTCERRKRRTPKRGRPITTGPHDRLRWTVARCFGGRDNCRRLVGRNDRAVEPDHAFGLLAIILWAINLILK